VSIPDTPATRKLLSSGTATVTGLDTPKRKAGKVAVMVKPQAGVLLKFIVPVVVVSEANQRVHWAVRHRRFKEQAAAVRATLGCEWAFPKWWNDATYAITLTRLGGKIMDGDNLAGAFKAVRDELAEWLAINDGSDQATWSYQQFYSGPKGIEISIFALERT
jgi:hypothetical protein